MKRFAMLVGAGNIAGHGKLPGVAIDVDNIERFLRSPAGGVWSPTEIVRREALTAVDLEALRVRASEADCTFTFFAGHGSYDTVRKTTVLAAGPRYDIPVWELNSRAGRQVIVVDACRVVERALLLDSIKIAKMLKAVDPQYEAFCRQAFDVAMMNSDPGITTVYSCGIGETAGEDGQIGGYFTNALIDIANEWNESNRTKPTAQVAAFRALLEPVSVRLRARRANQTPVLEEGRRLASAPFAVA